MPPLLLLHQLLVVLTVVLHGGVVPLLHVGLVLLQVVLGIGFLRFKLPVQQVHLGLVLLHVGMQARLGARFLVLKGLYLSLKLALAPSGKQQTGKQAGDGGGESRNEGGCHGDIVFPL